jgi:hypothetical protein
LQRCPSLALRSRASPSGLSLNVPAKLVRKAREPLGKKFHFWNFKKSALGVEAKTSAQSREPFAHHAWSRRRADQRKTRQSRMRMPSDPTASAKVSSESKLVLSTG